MFKDRYGPWALIVGGSEGVGAAFARQLADQGINLVLAARKPEPLAEIADEVRKAAGVSVRTLSIDAASPQLLDTVRTVTDDVEIGLLIYNAGSPALPRYFLDDTVEYARLAIGVNCIGPTVLCHHFAAKMKPRGRGGIILVGSLAGCAGTAMLSTYGGSKAYMQNFAEALWYELRRYGIDVLSLLLGATHTPASRRIGAVFDDTAAKPEDVAREGLAHLHDGPVWINGDLNRQFIESNWAKPRKELIEFISGQTEAVMPDNTAR